MFGYPASLMNSGRVGVIAFGGDLPQTTTGLRGHLGGNHPLKEQRDSIDVQNPPTAFSDKRFLWVRAFPSRKQGYDIMAVRF